MRYETSHTGMPQQAAFGGTRDGWTLTATSMGQRGRQEHALAIVHLLQHAASASLQWMASGNSIWGGGAFEPPKTGFGKGDPVTEGMKIEKTNFEPNGRKHFAPPPPPSWGWF